MEQEFIPYEQALELKELGFSQEIIEDGTWYYVTLSSGETRPFCWTSGEDKPYKMYKPIVTPLYQQAFRWFRDKHQLYPHVEYVHNSDFFEWYVSHKRGVCNTYEEAELACLKKLIEIVKNK